MAARRVTRKVFCDGASARIKPIKPIKPLRHVDQAHRSANNELSWQAGLQ
jgi:hypothetical protein